MRRLLVLSALLASACATSRPPEAPVPQETVRIPGSNGGMPATMSIQHSAAPSVRGFGRSADDVWGALPAVFAGLSIPIEERDVSARLVGNPSFKARRRLGDVPLGRYLDCGTTQGGPSADTYEIVMSVLTRVQAVGTDSAVVTTVVDGRGRPVAFSADYVSCGTRGELEKRFFDRLAVELHR